jgi:hypothetical protein
MDGAYTDPAVRQAISESISQAEADRMRGDKIREELYGVKYATPTPSITVGTQVRLTGVVSEVDSAATAKHIGVKFGNSEDEPLLWFSAGEVEVIRQPFKEKEEEEADVLNKTESLLVYETGDADGYVSFGASEAPERTKVQLVGAMWQDMGSPKEITVTVRPGDHLNAPTGEWWHIYASEDGLAIVTLCRSPESPDTVPPSYLMPSPMDGPSLVMNLRGSFDHEPTEEECDDMTEVRLADSGDGR